MGIEEYPIWMGIAKKYLGEQEIPGPRANPVIRQMLESTTLPRSLAASDESPWCSASVNKIMLEAREVDPRIDPPTMSAAASSWQEYGRELQYGQYGAIVLVYRSGGSGYHVGFYYDEDGAGVRILGGNQHDSECIEHFPWQKIACFRWPAGYPLGIPDEEGA